MCRQNGNFYFERPIHRLCQKIEHLKIESYSLKGSHVFFINIFGGEERKKKTISIIFLINYMLKFITEYINNK